MFACGPSLLTPALASGGGHRYWRVYITAMNGHTDTNAAEVGLRESVGGANVYGGTASADSVFGGTPGTYDASKAFDSNVTTFWSSGSGTVPHWIMYDYGSGVIKNIVQLSYTVRNDSNTNQAPKDFQLQYSDDNVTWTAVLTVTGQINWTLGETRTFNV